MNIKIDKRKKMFLLLDVETAGGLGNPQVYDLGAVVTDKQGNIYYKTSLLIKEVWQNKELMSNCYYADKIPLYKAKIQDKKIKIVGWATAQKLLNKLVDTFNIKCVCAYNYMFDKRAIANTHELYGKHKKFFSKNLEELDIWKLACETILQEKGYIRTAQRMGWLTEKGNIRSNAECSYRYITGDYHFMEAHTGLADALIESQILKWSLRKHVKTTKGLSGATWYLLKRRAEEIA